MQTPSPTQLLHCDHARGIDPALVNPELQAVHIQRRVVRGKHVALHAALAVDDLGGCLAALEARWHFSVLLLTLVAATRRFAFA